MDASECTLIAIYSLAVWLAWITPALIFTWRTRR